MKTLKKLWTEYRRELIVGIVTTIITSILWNLFSFIINLSPTIGASIIGTFVNTFYCVAAESTNITLLETLFLAFTGLTFGIITGAMMQARKNNKTKALTMQNDMSTNIIPITGNNIDSPKKIKPNKEKRLFILFWILLIFVAFLLIVFVNLPSQLYKDFNRDLTMISPYVEEHQLKLLQSEWVTMQSKEDYLAIYEVINDVKEANGLVNK